MGCPVLANGYRYRKTMLIDPPRPPQREVARGDSLAEWSMPVRAGQVLKQS